MDNSEPISEYTCQRCGGIKHNPTDDDYTPQCCGETMLETERDVEIEHDT